MKTSKLNYILALLFIMSSLFYKLPITAEENLGTITKVYTNYFDGDVICYVSEADWKLSLFEKNSYKIPAIVVYDNQVSETIWLPMKWDFDIDTSNAGSYTAVGTIDYTGYNVSSGLAANVTQDFLFIAEPLPGVKKILKNVGLLYSINTKMIEINDKQSLSDYLDNELSQVPIYAMTEYELDGVDLIFDHIETKIDIHTPGTYEVINYFKLSDEDSENFILPEELASIKTYICIYSPDELRITYLNSNDSTLSLMSSQDMDEDILTLEVFTSNHQLSDKELYSLTWQSISDFVLRYSSRIDLPMNLLKDNKYVYIQIKQGDKKSNILEFTNQQSNLIIGDYEGNRDGGDSEDETVDPPLIQPPPELDKDNIENQDNQEAPIEEVTESTGSNITPENGLDTALVEEPLLLEEMNGNTLKINGLRIQYLLDQYVSYIPFGWNNIQIELSSDFLRNLNLTNNDTLSLSMISEENDRFSIGLTLNNQLIKDIPNSQITLAVNKSVESLYCENNKLDTTFTYHQTYVSFPIHYTGNYHLVYTKDNLSLQEPVEPISSTPQTLSYLPIIIASISILLGIGYGFKKRKTL